MLAASADSAAAMHLLHAAGATLELQDALGRTALMFAAGNGCPSALQALLDLGASIGARDRKGRGAQAYCEMTDCSETRARLQARCCCCCGVAFVGVVCVVV